MRIDDAFRCDVPITMLQELANGVQQAFAGAEAELMQVLNHEDEQRNLRPWLRRSLMEQMLRGMADVHPESVMLKSHLDESGFWNHVHLKIGRFWITEHALPDDGAVLRPAGYKQQAAVQNQLFLFADSHDINIPENATDLYAVLVYGRAKNNSVGFAKIKFPMPDVSDGYLYGEIDLTAEFPHIFGAPTPSAAVVLIEEPGMPEFLPTNAGV